MKTKSILAVSAMASLLACSDRSLLEGPFSDQDGTGSDSGGTQIDSGRPADSKGMAGREDSYDPDGGAGTGRYEPYGPFPDGGADAGGYNPYGPFPDGGADAGGQSDPGGCGQQGSVCCGGATCATRSLICLGAGAGRCEPCGAKGQICCANEACGPGATCENGRCIECGAIGQTCCWNSTHYSCAPGGGCAGNQDVRSCVKCGGLDGPCCAERTCTEPGLGCAIGDQCRPCGELGGPCCGAGTCPMSGSSCQYVSEPPERAGPAEWPRICKPCGSVGDICCPNRVCQAGASCVGTLDGECVQSGQGP